MNKKNIKVLIVDDEEDLLDLMAQRIRRKGNIVEVATSAEEALALLHAFSFDVGIYDIRLPGMDGIELLRKSKEKHPGMEVIMLTGHGTIETAIESMKIGAYDYVSKPCALSELEAVLDKAFEKKQLNETNHGLKRVLLSKEKDFSIIGDSPCMQQLKGLIQKLASSEIPILIEGESGTGKELVARALHFWGDRAEQPFITVNSGALPESLLESELFGHIKGAFTGAVSDKKGIVELADRGTLFLDEIGEMPQSLQVKLLRFLESEEFRRVGDSSLRWVDVRIVAATNRTLEDEVACGRFREDLFYRLNAMRISVPPLRERKEDIPLLVQHFLTQDRGHKQVSVDEKALHALMRYTFPGNIRELAYMIERGAILAKGDVIKTEDLLIPDADNGKEKEHIEEWLSLSQVERQHIGRVMEFCHGNKTHAARILGISVRNLYRKLEEYHI
ncbi:sigma-54-dependent transcriptional regulator [Aneurinibacillus aneurinilyticus]|jgi:two-component system NtrC family response regulator/two-component system response regulator AtoC|uniref:Sigma-54-dependent Fis family transcriptional regulator n=1 Tax=Aneurinibacillus aneurinilyticus TaxID=1391 RepID=A0A848CTH3_ANEAE|nr:sigma-54 dependent transcriptional regulator [Aneurinibacillus aneurinilyticus]MCI1694587.1 sigma-54 dependent transcriptional regulator [Aneurinibacillus aneurinilyticus]MED0672231.1 sigma-54 dependent transcriptional regulator [Aneurinibacillus aneurinilyticus]NME98905.1 sigma-54-dependent Fis family transcriptional regulator [Aneurinibacillus aneurinilyticus]